MIYSPVEYVAVTEKILKAGVLADLYLARFPVPDFLVISREEFAHGVTAALVKKLVDMLPVNKYAVRFAALNEDILSRSQAGKYHSKIGVTPEDLEQSISEVLTISLPLTDNSAYVVIIQQSISADISGVIFSRDPHNARFMKLEYGKGTSSVVSGEAKTETKEFLIGVSVTATIPKFSAELVSLAMKIEKHFNFPQDIEWCVQGDSVYIVQSRPISTYTESEWRGIKLIDKELIFTQQGVCLKKSNGMETYDNPTPLDLSILSFLHAKGGAIDLAYGQLGLQYFATSQYIKLGNSLYVDVEREQQQLLPSYNLTSFNSFGISYFPLAKLIRTATNYVLLKKTIPPKVILNLITELQSYLRQVIITSTTVDQTLKVLTTQYKTIFLLNYFILQGEINIYAGEDSNITGLVKDLRLAIPPDLVPGETLGNSLSIADTSIFAVSDFSNGQTADELREVLRWQSIRLRQMLYRMLSLCLIKNDIDESLLPFFTIDSYQHNIFIVNEATTKREAWNDNQALTMPEIISTFSINESDGDGNKVLSSGTAKGVLTQLPLNADSVKPILYTETLSPKIIPYFKEVAGVICRYGGALSHAAIVAREMKLPVVQSQTNFSQKVGQTTTINTSNTNSLIINFEEGN